MRGTDTSTSSGGIDRLLAGIRRLTALADKAGDPEAIFRVLARELLAVPGAEEVHFHQLAAPGARRSWSPSTCSAARDGSATCSRAPSARRA